MSRVWSLLVSAVLISGGLVAVGPVSGGLVSGGPAAGPVEQAATPPRVGELVETGPKQPRWLSLPQSPIVLNPYEVLSKNSPLTQSNSTQLALNVGYYADHRITDPAKRTSVALNDLVMVHQRPAGSPPFPVKSVFYDSFAALSTAWVPSAPASATAAGGLLQLQVRNTTGTRWAYVSRTVTVDVDAYPLVTIGVDRVAERWALKVAEPGGTDQVLQADTATPGVHTYDLRDLGWHGTKTFTVRIFATGYQQPVAVDQLRIHSPGTAAVGLADGFHAVDPGWRPYNLLQAPWTTEDGRTPSRAGTASSTSSTSPMSTRRRRGTPSPGS